ncbi:MAG: sulfatase family protein [Phycisphaeraceae bacterium]
MAQPNIIYIFADDMGYGDMRCNDANCRIPTPNLDRLAERGMRFTDAHAGSSVCTPSRYNLLTGRYAWRSRLKTGIVWEWDGPLIEPDRMTVASLLREHNYRTACIGKWHLGWDWATHDGRHPNETLPFGMRGEDAHQRHAFAAQIDFTRPVKGGPIDRGFDSYFGVDVPNFPPYTWFEDDRLTDMPTEPKPDTLYGNPGPAAPGWVLEKMIPEFTRRATAMIEQHAATGSVDDSAAPLFLYFPLTSPHSPVVPNEQFKGMSGIGSYGDFVCEVDWVVGEIMQALERAGAMDNTLLIFASDNGPEKRTADDKGVYERARQHDHLSMGPLRGMKRDAWEGGHRIPMLAAWPKVVPAGTRCDQPVCLGDLMATCADILDTTLPSGAGEDSVSMLPLLRGEVDRPTREEVVHHSMSGKFAIRRDNWVLIDAPSGGDNPEPDWWRQRRGYEPHDQPAELFDLTEDLAERHNRYSEQPELVRELAARLERIKSAHGATVSPLADEHLTE